MQTDDFETDIFDDTPGTSAAAGSEDAGKVQQPGAGSAAGDATKEKGADAVTPPSDAKEKAPEAKEGEKSGGEGEDGAVKEPVTTAAPVQDEWGHHAPLKDDAKKVLDGFLAGKSADTFAALAGISKVKAAQLRDDILEAKSEEHLAGKLGISVDSLRERLGGEVKTALPDGLDAVIAALPKEKGDALKAHLATLEQAAKDTADLRKTLSTYREQDEERQVREAQGLLNSGMGGVFTRAIQDLAGAREVETLFSIRTAAWALLATPPDGSESPVTDLVNDIGEAHQNGESKKVLDTLYGKLDTLYRDAVRRAMKAHGLKARDVVTDGTATPKDEKPKDETKSKGKGITYQDALSDPSKLPAYLEQQKLIPARTG